MRPVISSIGSYNYRLAKMLTNKLTTLRNSKFAIKDTFDFVQQLRKLNVNRSELRMVSFDVTSLFTKIPLTDTINIILNKKYGTHHGCSKMKLKRDNWCSMCQNREELKQLLTIATADTHFSFNGQHFRQHNGVAMGSPLAPILADIFMNNLEQTLMDRLENAGVMWYRRYVDDTFVLIKHDADVEQIKNILNSFHQNINFTSEQEKENKIAFLDVLIELKERGIETSVYRKPTYTGLLTKWTSFVPKSYKIAAINSMVYRAINICSSFQRLHQEFQFIRNIANSNGYPYNFIESIIGKNLNSYLAKDNSTTTRSHETQTKENKPTTTENIIVDVPFVGVATKRLEKEIKKLTKEVNPDALIRVIQRPPPRVGQNFKNKDEISKSMRSNVVYKLNCSSCPATYIGKTMRQVSRRLKEHGAPTPKTKEPVIIPKRSARIAAQQRKQTPNIDSDSGEEGNGVPPSSNKCTTEIKSAVHRHAQITKHAIDWDNVTILNSDKHPYRLFIKESLEITNSTPSLNATTRSVPLLIYPEGLNKGRTRKTNSRNSVPP